MVQMNFIQSHKRLQLSVVRRRERGSEREGKDRGMEREREG